MATLKRQREADLLHWKNTSNRKPLIVRGARQVGKSHLIETFGQREFQNIITINFESSPEYLACFNTLKPKEICNAISVISEKPINPNETLLFLDEIQDCPNAIRALRYFKEDYPDLHVIAAGSLLELKLREADFRLPVGRVSFLYLYPLSFIEYLEAYNPKTLNVIQNADLKNPVSEAIHEHLLTQLKQYLLLGGMPEAVFNYQETQDIQSLQTIQSSIIQTYQNDFGHYAKAANPILLSKCFNTIPIMVGQQIKYNKIDPDIRSREIKEALEVLENIGVINRVHATSAQGLPLDATLNEKKFKLNFVDIGLVKRFNQLDASLLLNEDIMLLNNGALAEQFVGQELLAHSVPYEKEKLYFWARDGQGTAEVDYIKTIGSKIYPIEVKSGKTGKLRSLKQYLIERTPLFGIRVSQAPLSFEDNILSIPLYMISELDRLVRSQVQV